ncbi:triose-phosphate isomerase [Candidatus Woesearchaeota archaeon]|nr:triose-phosphate isomerase [Candidatus Woesearchaeota archaeon]
MKPLIIVNFKTYENATGLRALELAKICEHVQKMTGTHIIVAVQPTDIYMINKKCRKLTVFAQHIDDVDFGQHTGFIMAEAVRDAGALGTLLNHSEHKMRVDFLEGALNRARALGLTTVICANDPKMGKALSELDPDYIAVEPPELIGTKTSVSSAQPQLIIDSVKAISGESHCDKLIVGAGVHDGRDVRRALELGAVGVLISNGFVNAHDPKKVLFDLARVTI